MTDLPVLDIAHHDGVRILTLNRPTRLNALSGQLIKALVGALDTIEEDESARVVVIAGAPGSASSTSCARCPGRCAAITSA
jgi:enoyl-CoA hydratase